MSDFVLSSDSPVPLSDAIVQIYRHQPPQLIWTYSVLDAYQRKIAQRVKQGGRGGLLLSELAPVITLGRRAGESSFTQSRVSLLEQGIEVYAADRGGLATYHGPGQWVLFPVFRLQELTGDPRGVSCLVDLLLQVAFEVGQQYLSAPEVKQGKEQGVWSPQGKFASVGVQIQEGVILHGLSINGFKTPQSFQGIRPCGLDAPVSFLLDQPDEAEFLKLGQIILQVAQKVVLKSSFFNGVK